MVGAAVAAIGGVRRGTEIGKKTAELKRRQDAALLRQLKDTQKKIVEGIMQNYDKDGTGTLDKAELKPMLRDYSKEAFKAELEPTEDDIAFLFILYDSKDDKAGVNMFDKEELLKVCEAWSEFMKQKDLVVDLLQHYDTDKSAAIDQKELQEILDQLKEERALESVPETVTTWIFKQADVRLAPWTKSQVRHCLIFRSDSNGEDLEGFAGAGLFESVCAEEDAIGFLRLHRMPMVTDKAYRQRMLQVIANVGWAIEKAFDGAPQDIEGCVDTKDRIFIVQSRPQV